MAPSLFMMHQDPNRIPVNDVPIVCKEGFQAKSTNSMLYGLFCAGKVYLVCSRDERGVNIFKGHYGEVNVSYDELSMYFQPTPLARKKKIEKLLDE